MKFLKSVALLSVLAISTACQKADPCVNPKVTVSSGDSPVGLLEAHNISSASIVDQNGGAVFVRDSEGDASFRGLRTGEVVTLKICHEI